MVKSLGDYNIEQSSSSNINNIKWTQKNPIDTKPKNKKKTTRKISPSNILHTSKTKVKSHAEKVFKVEETIDAEKLKNKKKTTDKRFQNSSASNCKIKQGFRRPAR
ncbi:MAG: hypothetical protein OEL81_08650 [Nitrosopumilus sp.]|nr:hypothetical protein [Nitrosopumilus sp.]MDH3766032.1 hypothetical protein [Nitrosopumilus sp.]